MIPIEVFPEWRGKDLDGILAAALDLAEDTTFPTVRRFRDAGGQVAGHFQVYFPEEIAHAAGMLPFKVRGAAIEPGRADSRFGSYLCSIVKTSLELGLSHTVDLDVFFTHPICDAARNLAGVFGRNFPYPCHIVYLPQNATSAHAASYLRGEYDRVRRLVEQVCERSLAEDDLNRSIAVFNRNRALLRELYALRRTEPWRIEAHEAYALVALAGILPREEHNAILEAVLPPLRTRARKSEDRVRLVFEGAFCEQPPIDLLRAIGRTCYVVDDDWLIGLRWITADVPLTPDPLGALATAYLERSTYSPVQHDARKPKEDMLLERVKRSGGQAVVLTAAKMCEPGLEDQVGYVHALDTARVPHFVSEFEENMITFEQLEIQLETFMENLLFE
jgi:benzoyl-CoA reductase subunit C